MEELIIIIIFLMFHWKRARIHACIYMFDKKHTHRKVRGKRELLMMKPLQSSAAGAAGLS
jgi:hypothetical protein